MKFCLQIHLQNHPFDTTVHHIQNVPNLANVFNFIKLNLKKQNTIYFYIRARLIRVRTAQYLQNNSRPQGEHYQGSRKHVVVVVRARALKSEPEGPKASFKSTSPRARRARGRKSLNLACQYILYFFIGSAENGDFQVPIKRSSVHQIQQKLTSTINSF